MTEDDGLRRRRTRYPALSERRRFRREPSAGGPLPEDPLRRPAGSRTWLRPAAAAVLLGFGILYAWDVVEATSALAALLAFAAAAGQPLNSYAWLVLGTGILVPPAVYAAALLVGLRRPPLVLAAVLGVGLATSAALNLTLEALLRA